MLPPKRVEFWNKNPDWEAERIKAMLNFIQPSMRVMDIGAELGDITALMAKKLGKKGEMWAMEPVELMWPSIKKMFDLNGLKAPTSYVGFMGAVNKNDPIVLKDWPVIAYQEFVDGDVGFQHLDERWDLPVLRIDDIGLDFDMITMDTEGSEFEIILGAEETIHRCHPKLFISVHRQFMLDRYNQDASKLVQHLIFLGYEAKMIANDHEEHWVFTYAK